MEQRRRGVPLDRDLHEPLVATRLELVEPLDRALHAGLEREVHVDRGQNGLRAVEALDVVEYPISLGSLTGLVDVVEDAVLQLSVAAGDELLEVLDQAVGPLLLAGGDL